MYCQNQYIESLSPQIEELSSNELISDGSGIDYFILEEGDSEKPDINYLVTARYTGWA